jgi:transcriptional regulator with XRE-family HTH domain
MARENGMDDVISADQVRAARALLGWSRDDLADRSGVPARSLARFETFKGRARAKTSRAIRGALEAAGIEFIERGVRLK